MLSPSYHHIYSFPARLPGWSDGVFPFQPPAPLSPPICAASGPCFVAADPLHHLSEETQRTQISLCVFCVRQLSYRTWVWCCCSYTVSHVHIGAYPARRPMIEPKKLCDVFYIRLCNVTRRYNQEECVNTMPSTDVGAPQTIPTEILDAVKRTSQQIHSSGTLLQMSINEFSIYTVMGGRTAMCYFVLCSKTNWHIHQGYRNIGAPD